MMLKLCRPLSPMPGWIKATFVLENRRDGVLQVVKHESNHSRRNSKVGIKVRTHYPLAGWCRGSSWK
ncbi:unnamed protein product, partial [Nesidiocoris tenuis]